MRAPDKPATKTISELTTLLGDHLQPKPSILAERYKFWHQVKGQEDGIDLRVWYLAGRELAGLVGVWPEL